MGRFTTPIALIAAGIAGALWFLIDLAVMEALCCLGFAAIGGYELRAEFLHLQDVDRFKRH